MLMAHRAAIQRINKLSPSDWGIRLFVSFMNIVQKKMKKQDDKVSLFPVVVLAIYFTTHSVMFIGVAAIVVVLSNVCKMIII